MLILADYIEQYGVQAVMGRTLGAGEIRQMETARRIVYAYHDRRKAENWVDWQSANPYDARLLLEAEILANGG